MALTKVDLRAEARALMETADASRYDVNAEDLVDRAFEAGRETGAATAEVPPATMVLRGIQGDAESFQVLGPFVSAGNKTFFQARARDGQVMTVTLEREEL